MDSFVFQTIFQSVSAKLVEEFEGTIWTLSKKGRGPDPPPLDARLLYLFWLEFELKEHLFRVYRGQ